MRDEELVPPIKANNNEQQSRQGRESNNTGHRENDYSRAKLKKREGAVLLRIESEKI
jgi:hypothetical protein